MQLYYLYCALVVYLHCDLITTDHISGRSLAPSRLLCPLCACGHRLVRSATHQRVPVRQVDAAAQSFVAWSLSPIYFYLHLILLDFTGSGIMSKKEEEEIIRIAKKMDKMAQKKNGVSRGKSGAYLGAVSRAC